MALNWKTFTQRPYIKSLPLEEQVRLFNIANEKSINYRRLLSEQASQTNNNASLAGSAGDGFFQYENSYALQFDGVDDRIDCKTVSGSLNGYYATVSAWVKPTLASGSGTNETFLSFRFAGSRIYTEFQKVDDTAADAGKFDVAYRSWGERWRMRTDNVAFTSDNTWTHIAAVQNGNNTDPLLYVNGVLAASAQLYGTPSNTYRGEGLFQTENYHGPANMRIGSRDFNGSMQTAFNGAIDHIAVWNRALSASEIATAYGGGKIADISSLNPDIWFQCNEGSGTNIANAGSVSTVSGSLGFGGGTLLIQPPNSTMWTSDVLSGAGYYWGADSNTLAEGY